MAENEMRRSHRTSLHSPKPQAQSPERTIMQFGRVNIGEKECSSLMTVAFSAIQLGLFSRNETPKRARVGHDAFLT